jgi:hypothetical protein
VLLRVKALKQRIRIDGATNSRLRVDEPDCTMAVEAPHKTYFAAAERRRNVDIKLPL